MNAAGNQGSERLSAEERRDAILAAALPIFADKGFDAVTTREVAEAAGVSEALLYRHFDSKRAMYDAIQHVCIVSARAEAQRIEALPDCTSTLILSVYAILRSIQLQPHQGDPAKVSAPRLAMRSLLTDGAFAREIFVTSEAAYRPKIERCIAGAIASGDIDNEHDPACLGMFFAHHLSVCMVMYRLPGDILQYPGGNDPEWLLDQSVRFVLRGIGLTRESIAAHYNPQAFAMLMGAR